MTLETPADIQIPVSPLSSPWDRWKALIAAGDPVAAIVELVLEDFFGTTFCDIRNLLTCMGLAVSGNFSLQTTGNRVLWSGSKQECEVLLEAIRTGKIVLMIPTSGKKMRLDPYAKLHHVRAEFQPAECRKSRWVLNPDQIFVAEIGK